MPDAQLIDGALRGRAGRIDALWRQIQGAAPGHLKAQGEAVIVLRLHGAVGKAMHLPVFRQFLRDRRDCGRVGDAIDRLAQHGAGFQRRRQAGIVAAAHDDGGAVERLEATVSRRVETEGGEIAAGRLDVVDDEHERVGSQNVHQAPSL